MTEITIIRSTRRWRDIPGSGTDCTWAWPHLPGIDSITDWRMATSLLSKCKIPFPFGHCCNIVHCCGFEEARPQSIIRAAAEMGRIKFTLMPRWVVGTERGSKLQNCLPFSNAMIHINSLTQPPQHSLTPR
jgi:hypothetical protein